MRIMAIATAFFVSLALAAGANAQDYPTKPVKVIITFTEGSATDFVGRTVSAKLSELWGQPVEVENHAGAGGTIGAALVAKAPADGYTLLIHSSGYAVNPSLNANLPYDPLKAFVDLAPLASQPMAILVAPSAKEQSVADIIATAKARPGKVRFGSPGIGSAAHLAAEKLKSQARIEVEHVPYKGGPETIASTSEGKVLYSFLPVSLGLKAGKAGKLRAIGVTSIERTGAMPDVPTIAETGLSGFQSTVWWGLWAPAGIPDGVAKKLEKDIARALAAPDVLDKFRERAFEPMSMDSEEFSQFVRKEIENVAAIVKEAGIKPR